MEIIIHYISCWQKSCPLESKVLDAQYIRNEINKLREKKTLDIVGLAKILLSTPVIKLVDYNGKGHGVDC